MTAEREIYDVAICGAGPSGSTCALALEKSGLILVSAPNFNCVPSLY